MTCEVREGGREYLIVQLEDLIEKDLCHKEHAIEVLALFDEESEEMGEPLAYDNAQQDIKILLSGEWE